MGWYVLQIVLPAEPGYDLPNLLGINGRIVPAAENELFIPSSIVAENQTACTDQGSFPACGTSHELTVGGKVQVIVS